MRKVWNASQNFCLAYAPQSGRMEFHMKRFEKTKGFVLGVALTLIICQAIVPTLAASIEAAFNSINIMMNGEQVATIGQSYKLDNGDEVPFSILYNGTTYLPLRKIGELYGKDIKWDGDTQTASVNDKDYDPSLPIENSSNENDKYIELAKEAYQLLYASLKLPSSLTIYGIYGGYGTMFYSGRDVIIIDYSAMNGFGGYNRSYFMAWYDNNGTFRFETDSSYRPSDLYDRVNLDIDKITQ